VQRITGLRPSFTPMIGSSPSGRPAGAATLPPSSIDRRYSSCRAGPLLVDRQRPKHAAAGEPRELWFDPELDHVQFSTKQAENTSAGRGVFPIGIC
jgi:hypothetical protein